MLRNLFYVGQQDNTTLWAGVLRRQYQQAYYNMNWIGAYLELSTVNFYSELIKSFVADGILVTGLQRRRDMRIVSTTLSTFVSLYSAITITTTHIQVSTTHEPKPKQRRFKVCEKLRESRVYSLTADYL